MPKNNANDLELDFAPVSMQAANSYTAAPRNPIKLTQWLPWIGMGLMAAVLAFVVIRGPGVAPVIDDDTVIVTPDKAVMETVEKGQRTHALNMSKVCRLVESRIRNGEITNKQQLLSQQQPMSKEAHTSAYSKIDELDQANIPEGTWDPEQAARIGDYYKARAAGFERASK